MEIPALHLEEIHFDNFPTESQVADSLLKIEKFLGRMASALMAKGDTAPSDAKGVLILNAAAQLHQSSEIWRGSSGIAVPQLRPMPAPRPQ